MGDEQVLLEADLVWQSEQVGGGHWRCCVDTRWWQRSGHSVRRRLCTTAQCLQTISGYNGCIAGPVQPMLAFCWCSYLNNRQS